MLKTFRLYNEEQDADASETEEEQTSVLEDVQTVDIDLPTESTVILQHFGCFPHTLQRVIWDGFKDTSVYNTILAKTSRCVHQPLG